jgi:hypothetical protein
MTINNAESIPATNLPATRPPGRPPGSRNQRTIFVESLFSEDAEKVKAIVAKAIEKAIEGDAGFAKLALDRIAPAPKGRLVRFGAPSGLGLKGIAAPFDSILAAIGDGYITIEGTQLAKILEMQAKILAETDVEARLATFRRKIRTGCNGARIGRNAEICEVERIWVDGGCCH